MEYREGLFVGYRYYEAKEIEPLFPFGYGLSYTTFEYSNLKLDSPEITDRDTLQVSLDVKNTGIRLGKETVQLYVRDVASSVIRPEKELKGFEKIELAPGETITVTFTLDKRSFAYYNVDLSDWHVESGEFELLIGSSSRDITLRASVTVRSTQEIVTAIHRNTTIGDLMANPKTALILQQLRDKRPELAPSDAVSSEMMAAMIRDLPLRTFLSLVGGG
ncbi:fibronectin type III-like domain-contianing protein [Paenibacillus sp. FSL E2-0151]|uniref:fibronectin type III-like domain-contianing protein n=1 Tax=Paenibacillus sp. FSL E2-0151 TaxID=2921357 RepID=UPI0030EC52ED